MWITVFLLPVLGLYLCAWFYDFERYKAISHYNKTGNNNFLWNRFKVHRPEELTYFYKNEQEVSLIDTLP